MKHFSLPPRHDPADEAWVVRLAGALHGVDLADPASRAFAYVSARIPRNQVDGRRDQLACSYERMRLLMMRMAHG